MIFSPGIGLNFMLLMRAKIYIWISKILYVYTNLCNASYDIYYKFHHTGRD